MSSATGRIVRLFVSSPADVRPERARVLRVVERLNHAFPTLQLVPNYWDVERPDVGLRHFQPETILPSEADIVIGIASSRVGTALPPSGPRRENGSHYESGFVWEIEEALAAQQRSPYASPAVFLFRRPTSGVLTAGNDEIGAEALGQLAQLDEVFGRWTVEGDRLKAAYQSFQDADDFEDRLEATLRAWLDRHVVTDHRAADLANDLALLDERGSVSFVIRRDRLAIAPAPSTDDGELKREVEAALEALCVSGALERLHNKDPALLRRVNEYKVLFEAEAPSGYALYACGARIELLLNAREKLAVDDPGEALPPLLAADVSALLLVHHAYVASFPAVMARVNAGNESRRSVLSSGDAAARDARAMAAHGAMIERMADSAGLFEDTARSLVENLRDTLADKTPLSVPSGPRAVGEDVVRGFMRAVARIIVASTLMGGSFASAVSLGVLGNAASEGVKNSAIFRGVSDFAQRSVGEMERLWTELPEQYGFLKRLRDVMDRVE